MMAIKSKPKEKRSLLSKSKLERILKLELKKSKSYMIRRFSLKIEKQNAKYIEQTDKHKRLVEFEVGDLLWIHLCKDRFMP